MEAPMSTGYIDFNELKARVSIEEAAGCLGLKLTKAGAQFRSPCPACKSGGDRALVLTPAKNLFYCFAAQSGGDQIALAAHVKACKTNEAAHFLAGNGTVQATSTSTSTGTVSKDRAEGLKPLDYLEHEHPAVEAVGFDAETAKALGIGYAPKGLMRGTVAIPVRLEDGTLSGYIGVTEAKLPPRWHLETNVVAFPKKTA
jgi:DNA primase